MQVNPNEVSHVILSHLHADHVGGLKDFPNANCWASKKCLDQFIKTPKWRGFAKGLLHELFPEKWIENCKTFESCKSKTHEILGKGYDLFSDNSIVMYSLPGHAYPKMHLPPKKQDHFLFELKHHIDRLHDQEENPSQCYCR